MGDTQEHVTAWQAAGLIDAATADRIRGFDPITPGSTATDRATSPFNAMFGPTLTIGEVFSYLGAFFVLAASDAFLIRIAGPAPTSDWPLVFGTALQTIVLLAIGLRLQTGDRRRNRAAGLMFVTATVHAGVTGGLVAGIVGVEWPLSGVVGSVAALVVAAGTRLLHPGLLTQAGVLGAVTSLAAALLASLQQAFFPAPDFSGLEPLAPTGPAPIVQVLAEAAWWLVTALMIGLIGLREASRADQDAGASRRAGVTRFWAGLVAVVGFSTAITRSAPLADGEFGRVIEPWIADLAILAVALILVQRAFRRDDSAFVYPAALAMIIALTDFNVTYLGGVTEIGLLVEGLILLGVGFGAQRIRRMIGSGSASQSPASADDGAVRAPGQELRPEA